MYTRVYLGWGKSTSNGSGEVLKTRVLQARPRREEGHLRTCYHRRLARRLLPANATT